MQAKRISDDHMQMRQMLQHEQTGMLNQQSPAENYLLEAVTANAAAAANTGAVGGGPQNASESTPALDDPQLSGGTPSHGNAVNLSNFRVSSAGPSATSHPHVAQMQMQQQLLQQQQQQQHGMQPQALSPQHASQGGAPQNLSQQAVGGQHQHAVSPQNQGQASQHGQADNVRRSSNTSLQQQAAQSAQQGGGALQGQGGQRPDSAMQLRNLWSQDGGGLTLESGGLPSLGGPGGSSGSLLMGVLCPAPCFGSRTQYCM
jgi:hypothetical protein